MDDVDAMKCGFTERRGRTKGDKGANKEDVECRWH
jgi:hypothetical protein